MVLVFGNHLFSQNLRTHDLLSEFQKGKKTIRVILPENMQPEKRYKVLYVLPVHEAGIFKNGDGMHEILELNLHNRYQLICVAPSFSSKPWYIDHDMDPDKRNESFFMRDVIPLIDTNYPVLKKREGRLLVGFSKSGWGAMSLLLRYPNKFDKVAVWDPGVRMDTGPFKSQVEQSKRVREDFGSFKNFEKYRLSNLIKSNTSSLGMQPRIFYMNCRDTNRTEGGQKLQQLFQQNNIPHKYTLGNFREHRWDSGWLSEAVAFLAE